MLNYKSALLGLLIALTCLDCNAQQLQDSVKINNKFHKTLSLDLDTRQSFIKDRPVSLYGGKIVWQFAPRWRTGLGFYSMLSPLHIRYRFQDVPYDLQVTFLYPTVHLSYTFLQHKRWQVFMQGQYGYGFASFKRYNNSDILLKDREDRLSLVEGAVEGYYKVFNWVGLDAGVGYRTILDKRSIIRDSFASPIYILKIKVFLNDLYVDLFPPKPLVKP